MSELIDPISTLQQITEAVPEECFENITLVGSLAAGVYFHKELSNIGVRTKDADCLITPRVEAVTAGKMIAETLLESGWQMREEGKHGTPGDRETPEGKLPAVRLYPPGRKEWFIELLTVPENTPGAGRSWLRVETEYGHFGLPSFGYISLSSLAPIRFHSGITIARPEMMALANMLEHPVIARDLMSTAIEGRFIKRSNKDLGRVLALALLAEKHQEDSLLSWPEIWTMACTELKLQDHLRSREYQPGDGIRTLLSPRNAPDFDEAYHSCVYGLLQALSPRETDLRTAGERLIVDAVEPFEEYIQNS